jgi:hypothetical protein
MGYPGLSRRIPHGVDGRREPQAGRGANQAGYHPSSSALRSRSRAAPRSCLASFAISLSPPAMTRRTSSLPCRSPPPLSSRNRAPSRGPGGSSTVSNAKRSVEPLTGDQIQVLANPLRRPSPPAPPDTPGRLSGLCPAQLTHGPACVPYLRHVPDFSVLELHDVDVVGLCAFSCRRARAALPCVGRHKGGEGDDAPTLVIDREGVEVVSPVRAIPSSTRRTPGAT